MKLFMRTSNGYYFVVNGQVDLEKMKGSELFPSLDAMRDHAAEYYGLTRGEWCSEFEVDIERCNWVDSMSNSALFEEGSAEEFLNNFVL